MASQLSRRRFLELAASAAALATIPTAGYSSTKHSQRSPYSSELLPTGAPIQEPYELLHGGGLTGQPVPESPDPLVGYRWKDPVASDDLQIYTLLPVSAFTESWKSFNNLSKVDDPTNVIEVNGTGSVRFDFGIESAAWLEFDSPDLTGAVEMSISEYNEPGIVNAGPAHPSKTLAPKKYGNTYRLELNSELYEGVRFGWIHVRDFDKPWHVTAIRAVCQVKPTNYNGSFSCSDEMLTRIWYTGAYVVKANLCKNYFGAILMDRGDRISWTGDAHPAQAAALAAFGDWDFIKLNLESTADDSNGIESYALYWVLSLIDYYMHTGDTETMAKYIDHAKSRLDHGAQNYDDPSIGFYGWDERLGAGFEDPQRIENKRAYQMLFVSACQKFAAALDEFGNTDLANTYRETAAKKMTELRHNDLWHESYGVHALSDAVNTGLLTESEKSKIFDEEFVDRLNRLSFSPFNQYFILQALTAMNRLDEALVTVRDMWGGQIEYGGTTFFEVYTPSWNKAVGKNAPVPNCQSGYTSLAHPWGSGVTAWLSREVLGITPVGAGFSRINIAPMLGPSLTWVAGSMPTPKGPVTVRFDRVSGKGHLSVPTGSIAQLNLPSEGRTIERVMLDGVEAWNRHKADGVAGTGDQISFAAVSEIGPGDHTFQVTYSGSAPSIAIPPLTYAIPEVNEDIKTSGDWGGVYGSDGYILFDYDGIGKDRRQFPSYVQSIEPSNRNFGKCLHTQFVSSTNDRRALAPSRNNETPRSVGILYTGDPYAAQQTTTVDITTHAGSTYNLALYFVDWDRKSRVESIDLFDLDTFKRLSPTRMVEDFSEGKYLIYSCIGSIRVRFNQTRGDNAVLNALFFDPIRE